MKRFLLLALALFPFSLFAQQGSLKIEVNDSRSKEPLICAEILVEKEAQFVTGFATDFDGKAQINKLELGEYELTIRYVGYETLKSKVTVKKDRMTFLNYELKEYELIIGPPIIRTPLIQLEPYGGNSKIRTEQILKMPAKP
ncbi:MAG: carboxypeptidase-like regulatory domain-containing protein [Bacteroidia bacterium]